MTTHISPHISTHLPISPPQAEYPAAERGDALVFVSGVEEIERLMEPLQAHAAASGKWFVRLEAEATSLASN